MTFVDQLLKSVRETWYEFQAGPRRKRTTTKKYKRVPKWKVSSQPKASRKQKKLFKPTSKIIKKQQLRITEAELPKNEPEKPTKHWNEYLDTPQERAAKIDAKPNLVKRNRRFFMNDMSKRHKHMLFMGPGDEAISKALMSLSSGSELPTWAVPFSGELTAKNGKLYFDGLRMLLKNEKRNAVKRLYFDPKGATGIQPITDELRKYANVSRGDVSRILRSLETYQLNFGRRLPPKVMGKMSLLQPGMIAMDMFFPSAQLGWMKTGGCLAMMDCWSRYMRVFVLDSKKYDVVLKAMNEFLTEFASYGHQPRRILTDKGSDMQAAKDAIQKYKRKNDKGPYVLKSVTGGPVNIVESLNAQIQRKMQVFRTSKLTDDPSVITNDISYQINHQKRPDRGNLTPIQLLGLTKDERLKVNEMYTNRTVLLDSGMKPIDIGETVRILMMTRKQQVSGMGGKYKGFAPKWSKDTFVVHKRTRVSSNHDVFRYFVGSHQSYYRHELLVIPKQTDKDVPDKYIRHKQEIITVNDWSDQEWDSDDSRA